MGVRTAGYKKVKKFVVKVLHRSPPNPAPAPGPNLYSPQPTYGKCVNGQQEQYAEEWNTFITGLEKAMSGLSPDVILENGPRQTLWETRDLRFVRNGPVPSTSGHAADYFINFRVIANKDSKNLYLAGLAAGDDSCDTKPCSEDHLDGSTVATVNMYWQTLNSFISETDETCSTFCRFLQEKQYVLHHDTTSPSLFSDSEIKVLLRICAKLQSRHGDSFYQECLPFLGPLISRTPFKELQHSPPLVFDARSYSMDDDEGIYTLEHLSFDYQKRIAVSWLHSPGHLWHNGNDYTGQFSLFHKSTDQAGFLDQKKLFCMRYIDDYNTCYSIVHSEIDRSHCFYDDREAIQTLNRIESSCIEKNLPLVLKKGCIMEVLAHLLNVVDVRQQRISTSCFKSFFNLPSWKNLWAPFELGRVFSLGLSQYGPEAVEGIIDSAFESKRERLLWLFLGAHHWFHVSPRTEIWSRCDLQETYNLCCSQLPHGLEGEYISGLISQLPVKDRIWLIEQLVRRSGEFGVCKDLGGNIFNYLVIRDLKEADFWLCKLLEEIFCSRLQYVFEYAIGMGISEFKRKNEFGFLSNFESSQRHLDRLLRKDTDLYRLLKLSAEGKKD